MHAGIARLVRRLEPAGRRIRTELRRIAIDLPLAERVLDLGSGGAPYSDLFAHHGYVTADLVARADVRCDATYLPFAAATFDLVVCTEVLEHVPDPDTTVREIGRVLSEGGQAVVTTPLTWGVHESRDFHRWTEAGLRQLLERNGLSVSVVRPRGGILLCVAALLLVIPWQLFGTRSERRPWHTALFALTYALLTLPALALEALDRLDRRRHFTHGYVAVCHLTHGDESAPVPRRKP